MRGVLASSMIFTRKRRLGWWFAGIALLLGFTYYQRYEWRREWDLRSGKARIVHTLFGFTYATSAEFDTNVSQWLARDPEDEKWVEVASGGNQLFVTSPKHTENRIQWKLNSLYLGSLDDEGRAKCQHEIASRLLFKLEEGEGIGDVYDYCHDLEEAIKIVNWPKHEGSEFEVLGKICDDPRGFLSREAGSCCSNKR